MCAKKKKFPKRAEIFGIGVGFSPTRMYNQRAVTTGRANPSHVSSKSVNDHGILVICSCWPYRTTRFP